MVGFDTVKNSNMKVKLMIPNTSYFICFTVRSGSTLLSNLLDDTGIAGHPKEHFNHNNSPDNPQGDTILNYGEFVSQTIQDTTPNGVFGTKIGGGMLHDFIPRIQTIDSIAGKPLDAALNELIPNLQYIWLTRRNKVRQAVSHWMAIQSGRWHSPDTISNPTPEYIFDAIDHLVQELPIREAVWGDYFSDYKITPHIVVYEDYIRDMEGTVSGILDYLNIEIPASFEMKAPKLKPTANALTEEWVQRYREEKQKNWWTKFW